MATIKPEGYTEAQWLGERGDPTLLARELGIITDTGEYVLGDGITAFSELSRLGGPSGVVDTLIVRTAADLPAPVNGEHLLPSGGTVRFVGVVDIGANAIRIPADNPPVVRGMGSDRIVSSATGGVIRCTNPNAALILREFGIVATAGPCLNLSSATTEHQLNVFFVGLFGAKAGIISGFDVQAFKDCFVNATDGLTFSGATTKTFVSQCPFYGITGSAITFAAAYNATVVDIVTSFFKFDAPGVGITAEAGYTVGDGILRGSLIDGTAIPLNGLSPADINWRMETNKGVRDSLIAGRASATTTTTIPITTIGQFVQVQDSFALSPVSERFTLVGSELEYVGRYPALIDFNSAFTLNPSASDAVAIRATLNGVTVAETETMIEQGQGSGASSRAGALVALHRVVTGDRIGLAVANMTSTADIEMLRCTLSARG